MNDQTTRDPLVVEEGLAIDTVTASIKINYAALDAFFEEIIEALHEKRLSLASIRPGY